MCHENFKRSNHILFSLPLLNGFKAKLTGYQIFSKLNKFQKTSNKT